MFLGNLIFFIMDAFPINILGEDVTEFENHCHGKSPAMRNSVYSSIWILMTTLKAKKKTRAKARGLATDQI
ncbi:MAG: hypothetical protein Fur0020_09830 [Thermodesulfovibrionia bacterium]